MEFKEIEPTCQSCSFNRTERITPIDNDNDSHDIHGIDYRYRCTKFDMIVDRNFWCPKFELPF